MRIFFRDVSLSKNYKSVQDPRALDTEKRGN